MIILTVLSVYLLSACSTPGAVKSDTKEAWHGTKKVSKEAWHETKTVSKEVWKDGKKVVHNATAE